MDVKPCCVRLSVKPSRGLVDEKFTILVQEVFPGSYLTIHALHQSEEGHSWEAFAHYTTDAAGTVNVSEDVSLGGTYLGVEPMGLLWSLRPVPGSKPGLRLRKMNVQTPMEVTISVYEGHQTEGFAEQVALASVVVERWYMAPGVRRIPVTEDGFTATLFLPPGPGLFPGVLDLWGGGGAKLVEYRAALLASHGFASLALKYMTAEMEKGKMVDNEYFEVRCLVGISGIHEQPLGGTIKDILTHHHKNVEKVHRNKANELICRDLMLPVTTDPAFKVDMGRLLFPLLLVVGEDDQNWPAYEAAMDMKEMMEQAGNSHLLTVLSYPNAGHLIEPPYTPRTRSSLYKNVSTGDRVIILWGGEMVAHSRAQEDAWRKMLAFLKQNLFRGIKSHL